MCHKRRRKRTITETHAEYMILVNALRNLSFPDPTPAKFIPVTASIQQYVSWPEEKPISLGGRDVDTSNVMEIEPTSLYVRNAQVLHAQELGPIASNLPNLYTGSNVAHVPELPDRPVRRKAFFFLPNPNPSPSRYGCKTATKRKLHYVSFIAANERRNPLE